MKEIVIGDCIYKINYAPEVADAILNKVIEWMENPKRYASSSGEGIMQDDNCQIYAPVLISEIVDDILQPKFIKEK